MQYSFKQYKTPVSNRKFGFFFSGIFALITVLFYDGSLNRVEVIFALLTVATLTVTLFIPNILLPFNRAWMYLGIVLGKIVSPVIMGIIFFVLITPIAVITRAFGRDELQIKKPNKETYWKNRQPIGPEPSSFKNQF